MRRSSLSGDVLLTFVVTRDGTVTDAYPLRSDHSAFEEAAVEAILKWRFTPALADGKPVDTRMELPMGFRFRGGRDEPWSIQRPTSFGADVPPEFRWDTAPRVTNYSPPVYPRAALLAKQSGKVTVNFIVDTQGKVARSEIFGAAPPELAAASLAAVDTFRFEPAKKAGTPCFAFLHIDFAFSLVADRGDAPVGPAERRLARLLQRTPEKIVPLAQLDAAPKPRSRRPPALPPSFQRTGETGEASIEFIIDHRGFARLPRVLSATHHELGHAAVHAVNTWRFESPMKDGKAVDAMVRIPMRFTMADPVETP